MTAIGAQVSALPVNNSATAQAAFGNLTMRQIRTTFRQQFLFARITLRQNIRDQVNNLFSDPSNLGANGRPTAEALANFRANVAGAINATALRLSAQSSLLPGSSRRLVPNLQRSLLGFGNGSLTSQISRLTNSRRFLRNEAVFQRAINHVVNRSFAGNSARLNHFFRTTPLNRLSVDPTTGQRVSLSQFLGNQAISQINNSFGTLANSVSGNARTALFNTTGAFNPQGVTGFQQQFSNALGTAAFQTNSILSLFPNALSTLGPQLQSSLFATGTNATTGLPNTSFINGLTSLFPVGTGTTPLTVNGFNTGFRTSFTNAFQNFSTPLNSFFGVTPTTGTGGAFQLPTGFFQNNATFPSVFGSQFNSSLFNNGFNSGFANTGTGFPGFGTAPTGFNTGFGTGFNNFVGAQNQMLGFTQPTFGTGTGTTTGIGTGLPTGTGTSTGLGTSTGFGTGGTGPTTGVITSVNSGTTTGIGAGTMGGLGPGMGTAGSLGSGSTLGTGSFLGGTTMTNGI